MKFIAQRIYTENGVIHCFDKKTHDLANDVRTLILERYGFDVGVLVQPDESDAESIKLVIFDLWKRDKKGRIIVTTKGKKLLKHK